MPSSSNHGSPRSLDSAHSAQQSACGSGSLQDERCALGGASGAAPVACTEEGQPLQLSVSSSSGQHVGVEMEVLKGLLGQEMRTLIREELANVMALRGDSVPSPFDDIDEEPHVPEICHPSDDNVRKQLSSMSSLTSFSKVARTLDASMPISNLRSVVFVKKAFIRWGVTEPPERLDCLSRVADSRLFATFNFVAIATSCCILGFEANDAIQQAGLADAQPNMVFEIFEVVLLIIFVAELFVKIWRWRSVFFYGQQASMHWLDIVVVIFGIMSLTHTYVLRGSSAPKGVRLFRLTKVLRILRGLTMVKPLRAILNSIHSSVIILLSAIAFVSLIIYMFALVFVLGVADALDTRADSTGEVEMQNLVYHFVSVQSTMFSLLVSATDTWTGTLRALRPAGLSYCFCFGGFVLFTQFVVMNIILGLFVDAAMKSMMAEPREIADEQAKREEKEMDDVKRLLMSADSDADGKIDEEEWKQLWNKRDCQVSRYLASIGFRRGDVEKWFNTCLALSEDGKVPIKSFVKGCIRFKGTASCYDVHSLRWDVKRLSTGTHI